MQILLIGVNSFFSNIAYGINEPLTKHKAKYTFYLAAGALIFAIAIPQFIHNLSSDCAASQIFKRLNSH